MSIGAALVYAWSLWRARWRSIWGVLALTSLAATVYLAGDFAGNQRLYIGGLIAYLVVVFMNNGAVFRLAFADRHPADPGYQPGLSGLQWRAMEWRLVATSLLLLLFYLIMASVAAVVVGGLAFGIAMNRGTAAALTTPQGVAAALGPTGSGVVSLVALVVYCALIYVAMRLSLATAATADSGRISVLRTWALTKGQFWRIFLTIMLVELPALFVGALVGAIGAASQAGISTPDHLAPGAALVCGLIMGVLTGGVLAPLMSGVLAYYYRGLKGAPDPSPAP